MITLISEKPTLYIFLKDHMYFCVKNFVEKFAFMNVAGSACDPVWICVEHSLRHRIIHSVEQSFLNLYCKKFPKLKFHRTYNRE